MSREWKPGDVATAGLGVMIAGDDGYWYGQSGRRSTPWRPMPGYILYSGARPLVVIDPEDREQVERLALAIEKWHTLGNVLSRHDTANALRSLVTDPKPEEPQGLGAVVEDDRGRQWIRVDWVNPWCIAKPNRRERHQRPTDDADHASHVKWPEVRAVRVLSEGWSE